MKKDSIKNLGRNSRTKDKLPYNLENNVALNEIKFSIISFGIMKKKKIDMILLHRKTYLVAEFAKSL